MQSTITLILLLAVFLFPRAVLAGRMVEGFYGNEDVNAAVGLEEWLSQANAKWQMSAPHTTDAGVSGTVESRLDFRKINSPIVIVTGGGALTPESSFDVKLGYGLVPRGRGADTDRFFQASGEGLEYSQTHNTLDGMVRLWGVDFTLNVNRDTGRLPGVWAVVLGFFHYEDTLRMENGVQVLSSPLDGLAPPPQGPLDGLESYYHFSWNTLKAGIQQRAEMTKGFSYSVACSFYPAVFYRGDGYLNLRAGTDPGDFNLRPPNFTHKATTGYGYDAEAGLMYNVTDTLRLLAGYRLLSLSARNGTDRTFFSGASSPSEALSRLDWITVMRHGAYAGLTLGF